MSTQQQQIWVLIPASGIGSRMGSAVPKQYLPFQHKTVIEITLDRLLSCEHVRGAIVVISEQDDFWQALNYQHDKSVLTAVGASERSGSVFNGLKKLKEITGHANTWVMIHDAVRPCVTLCDLEKLIVQSEAELEGLFLAHPVADTLKKSNEEQQCIATVDRDALWRAFTPQMFPLDLIYRALSEVIKKNALITDDVSAVEYIGLKPKIVMGRSDNIKITYPQDILIAETIIKAQNSA